MGGGLRETWHEAMEAAVAREHRPMRAWDDGGGGEGCSSGQRGWSSWLRRMRRRVD